MSTEEENDAAFDAYWLDLTWHDNLAMGLAVAGALCAAYEIGIDASDDVHWGDRHWFPGCGREAPR